jgi:hypothetical protein
MAALKLYLQNATAPYTPTTKRGSWTYDSTAIKAMGTEKSGSASSATAPSPKQSATPFTALVARYTYTLPVGYKFSGNVAGVIGEIISSTFGTTTGKLRIYAFVLQGASDTLRGTLCDITESGTLQSSGTYAGESISGVLTDVNAVAGDTLVVEVGARASNAQVAVDFTSYYGGTGTDLADNGAATNPGHLSFDYSAPTSPGDPTLTAPAGGETWTEGETRNVTYTKAGTEQAEGWACAYEVEFSAAGTFADKVTVGTGITATTWAWLLAATLVASDTATCKARIRAYVIDYPTAVSNWSTSGAFTVKQSSAPVVTLIDPEDDELWGIGLTLIPTFVFGTADTENNPVHAELVVSYAADYSYPVVDTDSGTDYADWEESASPFSTWTTMGSGGATAGNRIRYTSATQFRYDYCYAKVRLYDTYSPGTFTEFQFTIVVDPTLQLAVTIGGTLYKVGKCIVTENTNGEPSPIEIEIDLDQYRADPPSDCDPVAVYSGLGNHNRVWNGLLEPWTIGQTAVQLPAVQDDFYLSHLDVPGNYTSADLGAQLAAIITACAESKITAVGVDTTTGVSAAITGKYKYIREHLQDILAACPAYLAWVDPGADLQFKSQTDFPAPTYCLYERDPSTLSIPDIPVGLTGIEILPGSAVQIGTLDRANRVRCIARDTGLMGVATNTTTSPTFAESPRVYAMYIESGNQTFVDAVAAAQLAFLKLTRKTLPGLPVKLEDGLAILRGTAVHVIIPRCGIDTTSGDPYPVRMLRHQFVIGDARTLVDVGEYAAPRDDPEWLFSVAQAVEKLKKEV